MSETVAYADSLVMACGQDSSTIGTGAGVTSDKLSATDVTCEKCGIPEESEWVLEIDGDAVSEGE